MTTHTRGASPEEQREQPAENLAALGHPGYWFHAKRMQGEEQGPRRRTESDG